MADTPQKQNFWTTLPGIITAISGFIVAVTGLIAVITQVNNNKDDADITVIPEIISFTIKPNSVWKGSEVLLEWEVKNAEYVYLQSENFRYNELHHKTYLTVENSGQFTLYAKKGKNVVSQDVYVNVMDEVSGGRIPN